MQYKLAVLCHYLFLSKYWSHRRKKLWHSLRVILRPGWSHPYAGFLFLKWVKHLVVWAVSQKKKNLLLLWFGLSFYLEFYIFISFFFVHGRHQVVRFYMRWCDFRRCDLRRCDLRRCDLKRCVLRRCVLRRCDWRRCDLRRCDLRRCYAIRGNARRCYYLPFSSNYPRVRMKESIDCFCFFFLVFNLFLLFIFLFFFCNFLWPKASLLTFLLLVCNIFGFS